MCLIWILKVIERRQKTCWDDLTLIFFLLYDICCCLLSSLRTAPVSESTGCFLWGQPFRVCSRLFIYIYLDYFASFSLHELVSVISFCPLLNFFLISGFSAGFDSRLSLKMSGSSSFLLFFRFFLKSECTLIQAVWANVISASTLDASSSEQSKF